MSKQPIMRVSPEFKELIDTIKKRYKPVKLSDPQASQIIIRDYWDMKLNSKERRGGGLL